MPVYPADVKYETTGSLLVLQEELQKRGVEYTVIINPGNPYLPKARNELAAAFLRSDCDEALWLDADVGFGPAAVFKIIERTELVVAGIYPKKSDEKQFPVEIMTDPDGYPMGQGGLIEAYRIPFGFVKTSRSVFEHIKETFPEIEYTNNPHDAKAHPEWDFFPCGRSNGHYVGEDHGFCALWIKAGGKIWVEPDITFVHKGDKGYVANYCTYLRGLPKPNPGKHYETAGI